jgi:hypothetical protein
MFRMAILPVLTIVSACSTTARLYPVEGPASNQLPVTVLTATINGIAGNNGSLTLNLTDGTPCQGEWSSAAGVQRTTSTGSLFTQYGPIYGSASTVTSGGGQNPGRAIATCTDGTRFDIEFVTGGGTANGFGFARDTRGNVYRVMF